MGPGLRTRAILWLPPLVYMGCIFYLSAQQNPLPDLTERVWDKLLHALEYGTLGALCLRGFFGESLGLRSAALVALLVSSLYGASDEWHQAFTPGRVSDIHDWLADTVGAGIGIAGYIAFALVLPRLEASLRGVTTEETAPAPPAR